MLSSNHFPSIPGVLSSTFSSGVPGGDHNSAYTQIENRKGEMQKTNLDGYFVDFDFIKQYGFKIIAGRSLSKEFGTDSSKAMIINETAAKMLGYHTPQEAVGRNFDQWGRQGKIIGVVKDFNYESLQQPIKPFTIRFESYGFGTISIKLSSARLPETIKAISNKWSQIIPIGPSNIISWISSLIRNTGRKINSEICFSTLPYWPFLYPALVCWASLHTVRFSVQRNRRSESVGCKCFEYR